MKLIFAGTPEFAAVALDALLTAGHDITLVLTQPDRPAGRGMKLQPSPVKQLALRHGIPVAQPRSLRLDGKYPEEARAAQQAIEAAQADAMIVAAYGLILPQWVLDAMSDGSNNRAGLGCLNIHASLLPRWRGAAPIHRAIEAGDAESGVTIMQMDAGLDTGDMLLAQALPISADDTTATLHDKLATLGGQLVIRVLEQAKSAPAHAPLARTPQPEAGVTYASKIDKAEAPIDWHQPAAVIERRIRAFTPFPGASTTLAGEALKIWQARPVADASSRSQPGMVLSASADGIRVACGPDGSEALDLLQLQRAGGKRIGAADFLRGHPVEPGTQLGTPVHSGAN